MSQQRAGPCNLCGKVVCLTSTGLTRYHGPLRNRCSGSNKPPNGALSENTAPPTLLGSPDTIQLSEEPTPLEYAEAVRRAHGKTLKFVPKGSRLLFANALEQVERATLRDPNSPEAWLRLSCVAPLCLRAPVRAGRGRKRCSLATHVNRQIDAFLSSAPLELALVVLPPRTSNEKQTVSRSGSDE